MNGIYSIFFRDGRPVDSKHLRSMSVSMSHRGIHGSTYLDGPVGLGHNSTDPSIGDTHKSLLFTDQVNGLSIRSDARIDNRRELLSLLELGGAVPKDISDSALILAAYRKWACSCVDHLLGDFAFVIWDKNQNKIFCGRDHMGSKPLIYYLSKTVFVCASEVGAIRTVSEVETSLNEERIGDFIITKLEGIDKTSTFFKGIERLQPGHILEVFSDRSNCQCYWQPGHTSQIRYNSDGEYQEAFLEILTNAVSSRVVGTKRTGVLLSGGIDSSSIGFVSQKVHSSSGRMFPAFSAISENTKECKETQCIKAVLAQGDFLPHFVTTEDVSLYGKELNKLIDSLQEPYDPMLVILMCYLKAKNEGFHILLDGVDGDLVTSLSPIYPTLLLKKGRLIRAIEEILGQSKNYYGDSRFFWTVLKRNLKEAVVPEKVKKLRRIGQKKKILARLIQQSAINRDFAEEIGLEERLARLEEHGGITLEPTFEQQYIKAVYHPYLTVGIERYNRVAAICGLEDRHPFLDKRLVEFMTAIPWDQKVRLGWSKYILRKTFEELLPSTVCWRNEREHLGLTFHQKWFEKNSQRIIAVVRDNLSVQRNYFDKGALRIIVKGDGHDQLTDLSFNDKQNLLKAFHLFNWLKRQ